MKKLIPALAVSLLLTSCENPLDTMNEMKDTTAKMAKTTKQMNQKMDQTNENTAGLKKVSEQGFSEEKREQKWLELIPFDHMGNALTRAKVLFLGYEYQISEFSANEDGLHERERLIRDALDEFFRVYGPVYENLVETGRLGKMSPLDLDGDKRKIDRSFYALATTMHFTNDIQEDHIAGLKSKGMNIEVLSMYDIFQNALRKEMNGEKLTENEEKVLVGTNRDMVIDLFQARMSFLTALSVKLTITKDKMSLSDKVAGLWFNVFNGKLGGALKVDAIFDQQNDPTREQALTYLDGAVKAKKFLEEIGVEPKLQYEMQSIMENLSIPDEDTITINSVDGNVDQDVVSDSQRLSDLREKLLNPIL